MLGENDELSPLEATSERYLPIFSKARRRNVSDNSLAAKEELLRHKNIRTTVRYTHVGYEQTRQTAEALSQTLE